MDQAGFQARISEIAAYTIVFFIVACILTASFAVLGGFAGLGVFARTTTSIFERFNLWFAQRRQEPQSSQNYQDIVACQLFVCSVALLRIGKG
jgi:hypothetical protein